MVADLSDGHQLLWIATGCYGLPPGPIVMVLFFLCPNRPVDCPNQPGDARAEVMVRRLRRPVHEAVASRIKTQYYSCRAMRKACQKTGDFQ